LAQQGYSLFTIHWHNKAIHYSLFIGTTRLCTIQCHQSQFILYTSQEADKWRS